MVFLHIPCPDFQNPIILTPYHSMLYWRRFACSNTKNPISHEFAMNFFIYSCTLVCAFLICDTSLVLLSCLLPLVSKCQFFDSILLHALLTSICMFEHKKPISHKPAMNFLIYLRALVCAFLTPNIQNQVFSIPYYRLLRYPLVSAFLICGACLVFPSCVTP